jgi:hypothetical protein
MCGAIYGRQAPDVFRNLATEKTAYCRLVRKKGLLNLGQAEVTEPEHQPPSRGITVCNHLRKRNFRPAS